MLIHFSSFFTEFILLIPIPKFCKAIANPVQDTKIYAKKLYYTVLILIYCDDY